MTIRMFVDDIRNPVYPNLYDYIIRTVDAALPLIEALSENPEIDRVNISLDHDAGDCAAYGGDYINILLWMERAKHLAPDRFNFDKFHFYFHTANPVGMRNMENICVANGFNFHY